MIERPNILVLCRRSQLSSFRKQVNYINWLTEKESKKTKINGVIFVLKTKECIDKYTRFIKEYKDIPKIGVISSNLKLYKPDLLRMGLTGIEELPLTEEKLSWIVDILLWNYRRAGDSSFDSFINEILALALHTRNEKVVIKRIADCLLRLFNADRVSIMLLDPATSLLTIKSAVGLPDRVFKKSSKRLGEKIAGWVAEKKIPLLLHNGLMHDKRFKDVKGNPNVKSSIIVPLTFRSSSFGVINFTRMRGIEFTEKEKERAVLYASFVAMILNQLKEIERIELLNRAVNNSSEGILIIDNSERVLMINKSAEEMLGIKTSDILHRNILSTVNNMNIDRDYFKKIISEKTATNIQVNYKDSKGAQKILLLSSVPVIRGKQFGSEKLIVLRDLTEYIELQKDKLNVERQNELIRWIEEISHQMNNPLSVILGNIHLIQDGLKTLNMYEMEQNLSYGKIIGEFRKMLVEINEAGERLAVFVKTLKNFGIDRDGHRVKSFLTDLIERAIDISCVENINNIHIQRKYLSNPIMEVVREQFISLMVTLIRNAINCSKKGDSISIFTEQKEGNVFIEMECENREGDAPKLNKSPFDAFYSSINIPDCFRKGYGFVASVVEMHRGKISFETIDKEHIKVLLEFPLESL